METKIPISMKILQLSLVLTAFLAFSATARPLVGDLNSDYTVDFRDLRIFG
jgi:hypothetical protein